MDFELVSPITQTKTFAVGQPSASCLACGKAYGTGAWRKRKGIATVRLADGTIANAEVHWYEAHGIGKRELKIKRFLEV